MIRQATVVDPVDLGVFLQKFGYLAGVFTDTVHTQRQRFQALEDQKGVERADGRTHVAQRHGAGAADVGGGAKRLGIDHTVVAHFGGVEALEPFLVLSPGEFAAVHNNAADAGAMAADVFGQCMHHDVGTVVEWAAQIGAGHGVVHNQRNARSVCNLSQFFEIGHVA